MPLPSEVPAKNIKAGKESAIKDAFLQKKRVIPGYDDSVVGEHTFTQKTQLEPKNFINILSNILSRNTEYPIKSIYNLLNKTIFLNQRLTDNEKTILHNLESQTPCFSENADIKSIKLRNSEFSYIALLHKHISSNKIDLLKFSRDDQVINTIKQLIESTPLEGNTSFPQLTTEQIKFLETIITDKFCFGFANCNPELIKQICCVRPPDLPLLHNLEKQIITTNFGKTFNEYSKQNPKMSYLYEIMTAVESGELTIPEKSEEKDVNAFMIIAKLVVFKRYLNHSKTGVTDSLINNTNQLIDLSMETINDATNEARKISYHQERTLYERYQSVINKINNFSDELIIYFSKNNILDPNSPPLEKEKILLSLDNYVVHIINHKNNTDIKSIDNMNVFSNQLEIVRQHLNDIIEPDTEQSEIIERIFKMLVANKEGENKLPAPTIYEIQQLSGQDKESNKKTFSTIKKYEMSLSLFSADSPYATVTNIMPDNFSYLIEFIKHIQLGVIQIPANASDDELMQYLVNFRNSYPYISNNHEPRITGNEANFIFEFCSWATNNSIDGHKLRENILLKRPINTQELLQIEKDFFSSLFYNFLDKSNYSQKNSYIEEIIRYISKKELIIPYCKICGNYDQDDFESIENQFQLLILKKHLISKGLIPRRLRRTV